MNMIGLLRNTVTGLIFVLVGLSVGSAQTRRGADTEAFPDLNPRTDNLPGRTSMAEPRPAMESVLNPSHYRVGPSDVFAINFWTSPPLTYTLTVTPEGSLVIPLVDEVKVAGLTLEEAKGRILEQIQRKYLKANVSITLVSPRSVVVTVVGNVLNPGSFTLPAYARVDKAIQEANKIQREETNDQLEMVLASMSRRNIQVTHSDGTSSAVDVTKYIATREDRWNPYLREGDLVVVPRNDYERNVFGVYGQVRVPGRYEFVQGDSLSDAIRIAHGFLPMAVLDSVEFTRMRPDGGKLAARYFDGRAVAAGTVNIALEPGDRIIVRQKRDERGDYRVTLVGEFKFPGIYPITKNDTRLSEIIRQAGGLTTQASLGRAELIRRTVQPSELALEKLESLRGGVLPEDSSYYYLETNLRIQKEIVNVDFKALLESGDSTQNVLLQNEDYIHVPAIRRTIYVFGQVVSPGNVAFMPGRDVDYYIAQAGGITDRGREGDLRIVKARTRQWLSPDETVIEEGDYIWVPKDPEHSFAYYMTIASQSAAVLGVLVGLAAVVIQAYK